MHRVAPPFGEARDDYAILAGLAERLGTARSSPRAATSTAGCGICTRGRRRRWSLRAMPPRISTRSGARRGRAADAAGRWRHRRAFRADPEAHRAADAEWPDRDLSRKRSPGSATPIARGIRHGWRRSMCRTRGTRCGWSPTSRRARLHSQLDFGAHSQAAKQRGREVARMHPADAAARGISGRRRRPAVQRSRRNASPSMAVAEEVQPRRRQSVDRRLVRSCRSRRRTAPLCVHGNPNVLTRDAGTSRLAQGCTGQLTAVEVERFAGNLPPIRTYDPPECGEQRLAAE